MMKGMIIMLDNFELPNKTIDKAYDDIAHPAASEAGKFIGRIPRAINAALSPLDCWILKREFNVEATKKSLEEKLASSDPNKIIPPEPYVAVPALQSIAYCITNHELHDLYANLLAKAMFLDTKDQVHPCFIEIIKQLSPNDALVFKACSMRQTTPAATLSIVMEQNGMHLAGNAPEEQFSLDLITDIDIPSASEEQIRISLDNLMRLGLIKLNDLELRDGTSYSFVKSSKIYLEASAKFQNLNQLDTRAERIHIYRKCITVTTLGRQFRAICIDGF